MLAVEVERTVAHQTGMVEFLYGHKILFHEVDMLLLQSFRLHCQSLPCNPMKAFLHHRMGPFSDFLPQPVLFLKKRSLLWSVFLALRGVFIVTVEIEIDVHGGHLFDLGLAFLLLFFVLHLVLDDHAGYGDSLAQLQSLAGHALSEHC